jgi:hypothetical protein
MTTKQRLEFIPLAIFLIAGICTIFKVPYCTWIVALSGFLLGSLYFYGTYWLYAEFIISLLYRILIGLLFSLIIFGCMFSFLKWPLWQLYSIIGFAGLGAIFVTCLINYKSFNYKPLLYRSIFFLVMLALIYGYRYFQHDSKFFL